MSVDLVSTCCNLLLSTNTRSGCFFALSWSALGNVKHLLVLISTSVESSRKAICRVLRKHGHLSDALLVRVDPA